MKFSLLSLLSTLGYVVGVSSYKLLVGNDMMCSDYNTVPGVSLLPAGASEREVANFLAVCNSATEATVFCKGDYFMVSDGGTCYCNSNLDPCGPGDRQSRTGWKTYIIRDLTGGYGDPHFTSWNGTKFDFHGGCDLVLLSNPDFNNGLGLEVHARTKIHSWWSFIERAAIKIGDHTLEIQGGQTKATHWLDGAEASQMETGEASIGDYAMKFKRINEHQSQTRVDLGHGNAMSIETFKDFVRVNVKDDDASKFHGSVGTFGLHPEGKLVGRDKTTVFENADEFGMEWQVRATDPKLFVTAGPIQHPTTCAMPDQTKKSEARRRLGQAAIAEEDAALACARVHPEDKDACIFDVLATNDKEMAGSCQMVGQASIAL